jgi:hypothetical protein
MYTAAVPVWKHYWSELKGQADEHTMMDEFCSGAASTNTEN